MAHPDPIVAALTGLLMAIGATPARASPVTFNTALPVSADHAIAEVQAIHGEAHDENARMRMDALVMVLGYGATPDLALFAVLPAVDRELVMAPAATRSASGIGDAQIMARYTLFQRDGLGRTLRLAPFAGIAIPTGDHRRVDALGPLPAQLQPGTGGWSPFLGAVVSWDRASFNLDGQLAWQMNSRVNRFRVGNLLRADVSAQKRLLTGRSKTGTPRTLFGGVELNYSDEKSSDAGGVSIPSSGSRRLLATPTLQFATIRWVADVGVQIPLIESFAEANSGLKQGITVRIGLRINVE